MPDTLRQKYIVLRCHSRVSWTPARTALPVFSSAAGGVDYAELTAEESDLTASEADDLRRDSTVVGRALSMPMKLLRPLSDTPVAETEEGTAWGIEAVGAVQSSFTGDGVTVAVLDTGIDAKHPAFAGVNLVERDFTGDGNGDTDGHGTHCAGIIFGQDVNGLRIGVARGVTKALIGKVIGPNGARTETLVDALHWAMNEGAHIASLSLAIDFPGFVENLTQTYGIELAPATSMALQGYQDNVELFRTLVAFIKQRGQFLQPLLVVAATDNESNRPNWTIGAAPPAAASGVISVAALGVSNGGFSVAPFSNADPVVAAPGVDITSVAPNGGLVQASGTSMATPHVAGVTALWAEKLMTQQTFSDNSLRAKLVGTATRSSLGPANTYADVGSGLIQAP